MGILKIIDKTLFRRTIAAETGWDPHALSSEAYAILEAILTGGFMASETGIEPSLGILAPTANRRPYCRGLSLATLQCPDHQGG